MTRTLDQTQSPADLSPMAADMLARLPQVRGRYMPDMPLAKATWFRVGGTDDIMFTHQVEQPQQWNFLIMQKLLLIYQKLLFLK